ncbi:unnamed protein product [Ostreobium quekettii]|uniref:RAP domain-containing protein n=1 Tax=Ostreobium quekettii TaxID=121088 RepID=A0A8S1IRX4_9CHLO|nr:unnamed protein product [Ostreobium quekettii]|eukprot:evm.model.scf_167.12 EVM.evm.TU.scf_167.12   scf_167:79291-81491(+)
MVPGCVRLAASQCRALDVPALRGKGVEALGERWASMWPHLGSRVPRGGKEGDGEGPDQQASGKEGVSRGADEWRSIYSSKLHREGSQNAIGQHRCHASVGGGLNGDIAAAAINKQVVKFMKGVVWIVRDGEGPLESRRARKEAVNRLDGALAKVNELTKSRADRLDHINVATMIHQMGAIAKLTSTEWHIVHNHSALLSTLMGIALEKADQFRPHHLSQIVWACSRLGHSVLSIPAGDGTTAALIKLLVRRASETSADFTPMSISQLLYGLARLEYPGPLALLTPIVNMVGPQVGGFSAQGLSNTLWSLAKLNYRNHSGVVQSICNRLHSQIDEFGPQALANMAWALAVLRHGVSASTLQSIEEAAAAKSSQFRIMEMGMLLWAFRQLHYRPDKEFLENAATLAMRRMFTSFKPADASLYLMSCADWNFQAPGLISALKVRVLLQDDLELRHCCNVAWCLAILGDHDVEALSRVVAHILKYDSRHLSETQKRQLFQTFLSFRLFQPKCDINAIVPKMLETACKECWIECQQKSSLPPPVVEIMSVLRQIGFSCNCPHHLGGGLLVAGTALNRAGIRFAVEMITPMRCFNNSPSSLLGTYLWRERVLEALGWQVLRIWHDDWMGLSTLQMKRAFLMQEVGRLITAS